MKTALISILGVSSVVITSASIWSQCFIPTFRQPLKSGTDLKMTATYAVRKNLDKIKERYSGRGDVDGVETEADVDINAYTSFVEADAEEINPPKKGQIITGTVIEMDDNGALLEIGGKMSGYLPLKEASLLPVRNVNTVLEIGQSVTAEVIGTLKGMPVMSLRAAQLVGAWENILNMRATDATFEVTITEINRGGAVVNAMGLTGFLPGSHLIASALDTTLIGAKVMVSILFVYLFNLSY